MNAHSSLDVPGAVEDLAAANGSDETTVLHVDDDGSFADLVSVCLERADSSLDVLTETDPREALDRLDDRVDCVVSDYDMPGMDGLELLEAVREEHPHLPFILFTGKGSEEIASEAVSRGVTDYLQKQSGTDQYTVLANRITNAVRRYRAEHEVEHGFSAMETAREGIGLIDENGTFIYVNPAYAETYGYDREELVGEHWETLYPEEHVEQVYTDILPSVPEEGRWAGETIHERKDGERIVVDHALAYTDTDALICLIQDITERKELSDELAFERRRFELFVDSVEEYAIFSLDPEGYVTSWNEGAERIKGYTEGEILGEHVSTFYPDDRAAEGHPDELLERALDEGTVEDEGRRVRKDGSEFWADVTITAVFDEDGQHRGFLKVTAECPDKYRDGVDVDGDEGVIEQAVDELEDVFYVLDTDYELVRVSDSAVEVTGYDRTDLLDMSVFDVFPDDEAPRVRTKIENAMAEGQACIETPVVTASGRRIPYEFRTRRLTDEDDAIVGVVGIGRDVSARKRRERQLEQQLDQFEHFGSVLAHDLRTPLQTAVTRLDLARETGEAEHLDELEDALVRLDDLVENLSSVMREGDVVTDLAAVDLAAVSRSVWEPLDTGDAALDARDATIRADEGALKRLLENLFTNALDHAGDDVTVTVGPLSEGFYVEDDGPGFPEDTERVFEAGYTTAESGSGFGLASVKQIAVAHGWEITATDAADGGARFEVTGVDSP